MITSSMHNKNRTFKSLNGFIRFYNKTHLSMKKVSNNFPGHLRLDHLLKDPMNQHNDDNQLQYHSICWWVWNSRNCFVEIGLWWRLAIVFLQSKFNQYRNSENAFWLKKLENVNFGFTTPDYIEVGEILNIVTNPPHKK